MRGLFHRLRYVAIATSLMVLAAGCTKPGGKKHEDHPAFNEGGKMTLVMDGQPYEVNLSDIQFVNADGDYPDYVDVNGNKTRLMFECRKDFDIDFDSDAAYAPIVNAALPLGNLGLDDEELTLQLPGLGEFTATSGSLTLHKFRIGRDGRDWWDGQLTLAIDSDQGPKTLTGTFSWCIVPVW